MNLAIIQLTCQTEEISRVERTYLRKQYMHRTSERNSLIGHFNLLIPQ